ncbi:MAG: hypothetical protein HY514_03030 [Candidatus Aenigmarchaeota archaeon]|nr:hypothetical protein [Candidatus Aenigmarchaeota archaeon]
MDDNAVFEAGRKIGHIEEVLRDAGEYSQRLNIRASRVVESRKEIFSQDVDVVYMSIEDAMFGHSISRKEFEQRVVDYRERLVGAYQDFEKLLREFPDISYFRDEFKVSRTRLRYETALGTIEDALQKLGSIKRTFSTLVN